MPQSLDIGIRHWKLHLVIGLPLELMLMFNQVSKRSERILLNEEKSAVKYVQFRSECENSIQFTLQSDTIYNTILLQTHFMTYPRQYLNMKESQEINI